MRTFVQRMRCEIYLTTLAYDTSQATSIRRSMYTTSLNETGLVRAALEMLLGVQQLRLKKAPVPDAVIA
jgi:hypothetical protein